MSRREVKEEEVEGKEAKEIPWTTAHSLTLVTLLVVVFVFGAKERFAHHYTPSQYNTLDKRINKNDSFLHLRVESESRHCSH